MALAPISAVQCEPKRAWRGGDDPLVCVDMRAECRDVRTFWFAAASGSGFAFEPGQFVTIELPLPTGPVWRSFTIASPPTRPQLIALTVKAQQDGKATRWLHDRMRPGVRLRAQPPAGRFSLAEPPATPLLLASAGSGATPMAAMARWLHDLRLRVPVHYLHVGRSREDLLFRDEIETIAEDLGGWRCDWLARDRTGRLDGAALAALVPDLAARSIYCCGPLPFMTMVRETALACGGAAERYHEEAFGGCELPLPDGPEAEIQASVRFEPSGAETVLLPGETLLAAGLRLGLSIPNACRQGICGSCRIRKRSGDIEMRDQGGLDQEEIAAGDILACCSHARGPIVLELL